MRKRLLSLSVICALSVSAAGYAADDVYVDLSVLDAAPRDSIGFVASQPLFPVYEKPKIKTVRKIKPRKQVKKPVVLPVVKPEPKMTEVSAQETAKPEMTSVAVKAVESKDNKTETLSAEIESVVADIVVPAPETQQVAGEKTVEDTAVLAPDPSQINVEKSVTKPVKIPVVTEEENKDLNAEPQSETNEPEVEVTEQQPSVKPETELVSSVPAEDKKITEPAPVVMSATTTELPETSAINAPKEVYSISFAPETSELSAEMQQRLEEAVRTFDAEQKKKISIKAHNFDNGEDSFRKKRISLMRATEVRSWLLNRGFKNFSIRVVNSSIDEENKDMVEIEELD